MELNNLSPRIKLNYPEFQCHNKLSEALGWSLAYSFDDIDGISWYKNFVQEIFNARDNKKYLPIYRMGDGEYSFLLQNNILELIPYSKLNWKQKILKFKLQLKKQKGHTSGLNRDGIEQYSEDEVTNLYSSFIEDLKFISEKGILALGFDTGNFYGKYVPYVINAFIKNKIFLNSKNYYHVYHVYALFSSSDGYKMLNNQNILIITSLNDEKKSCFNKELTNLGVKRIDYYPISATKAMKEKLDLSKIAGDVDIILVGAGVGSVNIISQLHELHVPCIDVGAILGNYINPARKLERPFMVIDKDFDLSKIKFLSDRQKKIIERYLSKFNGLNSLRNI